MHFNDLILKVRIQALGAVDSLLQIENAINEGKPIPLWMSHKIEDAVPGRMPIHRVSGTLNGPVLFYSIVTAVLVITLGFSLWRYMCPSH